MLPGIYDFIKGIFAPLGDYRVALSVDERDVTFLQEGQRGQLVLAPRPELDLDIVLSR